MSQYRFEFGEGMPIYDGPPCPRIVECDQCTRIMEAPLLDDKKPKKCCMASLKRALQAWLNDDYAPHMDPSPVDLALAGLSLDALVYDMEHGYTDEFVKENPHVLEERDKFLNKSISHRLRQQGFQVHIRKDGTIVGMTQLSKADDEGDCDMLELEIDKLRSNRPEDPGFGKNNVKFEDHTNWGMGPIGPVDWEDREDPDHTDWV